MMEACNLFRGLKQQPILNLKLTSFSAARSSSTSSLNLHSGGGKLVKRAYDALLLDAGGTLLQLAKPVEETYAEIGRKYAMFGVRICHGKMQSERRHLVSFYVTWNVDHSRGMLHILKHGLTVSPGEIKQGFKRAFSAPWPEKLRYQGDGKPFWKLVVSEATGCANEDYFEEVYGHYAQGQAWRLPTGAYETMSVLKDSGVKMVVVSNFDNRLRKLLKDLNVIDLFDALIISSEVGYEKPDAEIFKAAIDQVRVEARKAVHVGDDEKADKEGANAVEIDCWLWKKDVKTFADIQSRILLS